MNSHALPGSAPLDRSVLERWWQERESALFKVAVHYVSSADAANDVLQDLAVLAWRRSEGWSNSEEFGRWAFARVRWLALDALRASRRLKPADFDVAGGPHQEQRLIARELSEAIRKLPPRQQQVLRLTLVGLSTAEISDRLVIAPATVRSLQRFGRQALVSLLGAAEADHD